MTTVWVAEDYAEIAQIYCDVLSTEGYTAKCFTYGNDLLKELQTEKPDCIIIDLALPDMNGATVAKSARHMGYNGPLIAVSGMISLIDEEKLKPFGFSAVLEKPLTIRSLAETVKQVIEGAK